MTSVSSQASLSARLKPKDAEPDEQWKADLRKRIEVGLRDMVEEAKKARDAARADARDEAAEARVTEDYEARMATIRKLAQDEFNTQLHKETLERQWALGQVVGEQWSDEVVRQQ
ncbi:hypothetical protein DENSPDRAFT_780367, partial [Dentipellis sp. KUC8613]